MTTTIERTELDIQDARDIFEHLQGLTDHWSRVDLMCDHLPGWKRDRVERAMPHFLAMDAAALERVITYQDPTGDTATGIRRAA